MLKDLKFDTDKFIQPPPNIIERGMEAIQSYLKDAIETTTNNKIKIMTIGDSGVGKVIKNT
jgi:internalin A